MDNNNNNYKLFKKIFNNKYLFKLIFQYVYQLNEINSLNNNRYSYNLIPLNVIFKNNLVEIFLDRIKVFKKSTNEIDNLLFIKFLSINSSNLLIKKQLISFFKLNKDLIYKDSSSSSSSNNIRKKDILELCIEFKQFELLQFLYNDEINKIQIEKKFYYKEKEKYYNELNEIKNDGIKSYGSSFNFLITKLSSLKSLLGLNRPFLVYSNFQLVKIALQYSSLEIIKFLKEIVDLDFSHFNNNLLYWSILSNENRNEIVLYLLDELNYKVPLIYNGVYDGFYKNLSKLDYSLFKRIVKDGNSPLLIRDNDYNTQFPNLINEIKNSNLSFDKQLNGILVSIYTIYHLTKSIEYLIILKLIKKLIKCNNNNQLNIELIIKKVINKKKSNNSGYFNLIFIKYFSNNYNSKLSTLKEIKNENYLFENILNYSNIDYNDFNLEREIKRIYIFQFLNSKSMINNDSTIDLSSFRGTLLYFSIKYNQYQLIELFLENLKNNNKFIDPIIEFELIDYTISLFNLNAYIYFKENNIIQIKISTRNTISNNNLLNHNFKKENIEFYLKFLSNMCKFNDSYFKFIFIKLLLILDNETDIEYIDKLISILNQYIKINQIVSIRINEILSNNINHVNSFIALHLFKNYKQLFIGNWNDNYLIQNYINKNK